VDKTPIVIRPASPQDVPSLGRLGVLMVRTHHAFDPRRFIAPAPRTAERYGAFLGEQLAKRSAVVLVAVRRARVIGYAYAGLEGYDYMALRGPAGALYDIVVAPAHRGRGVGRLLLDAALAWLDAQGAPRAVLSTAEQNVPAQRLFARAGFRRTMIEMTREAHGGPAPAARAHPRSAKRSKR